MKKYLALLLSIVMILSLAACGKDDEEAPDEGQTMEDVQTTEQSQPEQDTLGDGQEQSGEVGEEPAQDEEVEEESDVGLYVSDHLEFTYPKNILTLTEEELEGDTFMITLTSANGGLDSVPRIDILSVTTSGLTEEALSGLTTDEANEAFEAFAVSLLSAYYNVQVNEDGTVAEGSGFAAEFANTAVEVADGRQLCYTQAAIAATGDMPEMVAHVELNGANDIGAVSIILAQKALDEASMNVLEAVAASIVFK